MGKQINEREVVLEILMEITENGAYSHKILGDVLSKYQYLEKRERAFITRVVEGTLEHMIEIDYILNQISKTKVKKMKPVIRNLLRSSVYQLKYMDSVPDHAVCSEAVKLAVRKGFSGLRGYVNGVLRNVVRKMDEIEYPKEDVQRLSVKYSVPEWILSLWKKEYGEEITEKMAADFQKEKPITIRCCMNRVTPEVLKEKLEAALSQSKLQEYKVTEENGELTIYAKGVPAHASTPALGVNAAGVTFECLAKAGFEDDFVEFYNSHLGTSCDGSGIGLKFADEYGDLTFCNGIVKTENGVVSCTIDIRVPVTLGETELRKMCEDKLEDKNGRIEIVEVGAPLFFPKESPLVNALYKAYTDVTGDTEHKPVVIGGGTYAKSLKNIIAFGPEKEGIDYRIHGADEFILVSGMEEAVLIYMEAVKNLLAI
mgnify:CR=1 FL=1